ncbi:hypothetical protein MNBD_CHLOROFLEXI01-2630 [hydrothermal vent metagenome]|uniref:Uncharacterized protein n=1 Tax=hydrothermal vent metagenome TaxID=652676 RepID=A0A3B0VBM2_9ZZZZ
MATMFSAIYTNKELIYDIIDSLRVVTVIDDDFMQSAREAIEAGRISVAIVLIATTIEHKVNHFYRGILEFHGGLFNIESNLGHNSGVRRNPKNN